ncbi:MAG: EAL domain-containing protein [Lachnospiraceae bacterium]|nr:EAL domain-containing protein [Lachnospiraceae bacterium]
MKYVIHYDVAGVIILATVMLHFFYKKTINTRQTRAFSFLIWTAFISNALDLITIYTIEHSGHVNLFLNYLLNEAYLIAFNAIPVIYFIYILLTIKSREGLNLKEKVSLGIPISISVLLILMTPWTKGVFYFDKSKVYLHGSFMLALYVIAIFYMGSSLIYAIVYHKKLTGLQKASVYCYTISSLVAIIVQMLSPKLMIIQFAIALSVMLIYLSMENPEDYSDRQLGIYNRMAFLEMLSSYIEKEKHFDVLGLQVEGLKYISETLGVDSEKQLLKEIAEFLNDEAGHKKVFYLSGSCFVVMAKASKEEWERLMGKIHERFRCSFSCKDVEVSLSVPMCMISYPDSAGRLEDVVDMIGYSLVQARTAGDEVVIYPGEDILKDGRREQEILQIMKQALREKKFEVYYQPIYSVMEKRFVSAEALVRLKHWEMGFISPEEFIPLAEKNGLILEIGEFVFREVCRFMSEKKIWEYGIEYIDVNLSAVQCMQERLHESLLRIMDEYHLEYHYINLEITEPDFPIQRTLSSIRFIPLNWISPWYGPQWKIQKPCVP